MRLFRQKNHGNWQSVVDQLMKLSTQCFCLIRSLLLQVGCPMTSIIQSLTESEIAALVQRMELLPQLVRRQQEELIVQQVSLSSDWLEEQRQVFLDDQSLADVLETRGWTESDLDLHLRRPESLRRSQNNVLVGVGRFLSFLPRREMK